jgi:hypothetical protein
MTGWRSPANWFFLFVLLALITFVLKMIRPARRTVKSLMTGTIACIDHEHGR